MSNLAPAVAFAVLLPGLLVAHAVGDRWVQTPHQAVTKGHAGHTGRVACAAHVLSYTAVTATVVAVLWSVLGLAVSPVGFLAGQAVSAVSHYWIDRRSTLAWLIDRFMPWKRPYYYDVPGGAEQMDQSAHLLWLFVAALITAVAR
jgi:hypothetical protein